MAQDETNKFSGPTVMYGPKGDSQVFHHSKDVPAGWKDAPASAADETKKTPAPPATLPMARDAIIAALESGGVEYKKNAGTKALYDQLVASVQAHLTTNKIEFPADATAPELLELLTPAQ